MATRTVEAQTPSVGKIRQEAWDLLLSILVANREDMRYCLQCGEVIARSERTGYWWHMTYAIGSRGHVAVTTDPS
jgi:hypothetical protein